MILALAVAAVAAAPAAVADVATACPLAADTVTVPVVFDLWLKHDRPLAALAAAESLQGSGLPPGLTAQIAAVAGAETFVDAAGATPDCTGSEATTAQPAIPALLARIAAAKPDIVLLNESHATQLHRAFALEVVAALRRAGFLGLGGETFAPGIAASLADGAPDAQSGVYTSDPLLAELVRRATADGMQLFGYDLPPPPLPATATAKERGDAREAAQAAAAAAFVREHDLRGRTILLVGSEHGARSGDATAVRRLAQRLEEDFGLRVYSIDQVFGTVADGGYPLAAACAGNDGGIANVRAGADGALLARAGFDATVFHPAPRTIAGRPDWLRAVDGRTARTLAVPRSTSRTLVRAHAAADPVGTIAIDQAVVAPGATAVTLFLPAGEMRFSREDEACGRWPIAADAAAE